MSRPSEPQKKSELLERCLAVVIETGVLDTSLNAIAKRIGTSSRMLVYHFGSKQELEQQIIERLETRLRETLWSFQAISPETTDRPTEPLAKSEAEFLAESLAESLLALWQHLIAPEMQGLLKLTMELNQRAIQGDVATQRFLEQESQKWIEALSRLTGDQTTALLLFHGFQGAILDFLTTGNADRGQQTIETIIRECFRRGEAVGSNGMQSTDRS